MASQGRYVPPARGRFLFRRIGHFWPLTSDLVLWHNVRRRPHRVLLGFLSPRFSFPCAVGFFFFGRPVGSQSAGGRPSPKQSAGRPVRVGSVGREGGVYLYTHPRPTGLPNRQPTAGTTVFSVGRFGRRLIRRPAYRDFPTRRESCFLPPAEGCISRRSSTEGRCRAVRT